MTPLIKFRALNLAGVLRFDYYAIIAKKHPAFAVSSYIPFPLSVLTVRLHSQAYLTLSRLRPLSILSTAGNTAEKTRGGELPRIPFIRSFHRHTHTHTHRYVYSIYVFPRYMCTRNVASKWKLTSFLILRPSASYRRMAFKRQVPTLLSQMYNLFMARDMTKIPRDCSRLWPRALKRATIKSIKFYFKTLRRGYARRNECVLCKQVFQWSARFRNGHLENDKWSGPLDSDSRYPPGTSIDRVIT